MTFFLQSRPQPRWTGITFSALLAASSVANAHVIPRQIQPSQLLKSYDYVVVGGGTGGLTVADRLSEDPDTKVLVLEAGGFGNMSDNLLVRIADRSEGFAAMVWPGLQSVPQPNLNGKPGDVMVANRVGGGSAINAMMSMRGSAEDYDRWATLFGSEAQEGTTADWSWDGILPFFKKVIRTASTGGCEHQANPRERVFTLLRHLPNSPTTLTASSMILPTGATHRIFMPVGPSSTTRA